MKILFVTTISGTVNAFLVPHIKWLIEQGNEVGVAFNIIQEVNPELTKVGCKVHQVNFQRNPIRKENFAAYKKIKEIIYKEGYEFVHVHTPVASFLTRFACRKYKNVKVLYTAHGFHFFKGAPKRNWVLYYTLEKLVARWTDGLITLNEEDYQSAKRFKLRRANSIYKVNGVGLDLKRFLPQTQERKGELRKDYGYNAKDFILISVGELSYTKHQDLLIEAISLLKDQLLNLKLFVVGEGDLLKEYRDLAKRLGVEENVDFLGYRNDVPQLMSISDLAISTSRREGLPVNVMEAMATGLPLVVTDCRGNRDLVRDGENGLIIGFDDVEGCANAIKKLYHSNELRQEQARNNLELIQNYSLENVFSEMKAIYSKQSLEIKVFKGELSGWMDM